MRETKQYDEEFKREAIRLAKASGKAIAAVANDLGIKKSTLYGWVYNSAETETGEIVTNSEMTVLKRKLADVTMERDILKKAVAIFSVPSK